MNAIISLCHFCEFHGPKVIYCTQPFRPQEHNQAHDESSEGDISHRLKSTNISSASGTSTDTQGSLSSTLANAKDNCEGCKSVQTGFVSHDDDALVSYVSTQQPYNPEVFTRIRQACIRSLSVESCPGRVGPMFFGDKQYGYVLSYTFHIPDNQARGMQRSFSVVVVMMDKIYLLNSWPFLVPHLKIVIDLLQSKAQKIYDQEEARCPQRPYRLGARLDSANFIKQRGGNKPARSLEELTGDKNVFCMLHIAFLWILKACGSRISETLLEGPPTEDTIIDMEKQEETEEGFIKLFTRKLDQEESVETDVTFHEGTTSQDGATSLEATVSQDATAAQPFYTTIPSDIDSKPQAESDYSPVIKNIRQLKRIMGSGNFLALAHHAVVGNQVIVTGHQEPLVKSFLTALKSLLPKGCCRMTPYSRVYEASWKCNFLGLSPDVALSQHVTSSELFVLVDIVKVGQSVPPDREPQTPDSEDGQYDLDPSQSADYDVLMRDYLFKMSSPITLPVRVPKVLEKMMIALRNENLSSAVVETALTCLKEEWMNKVKVLFKFTKAGGNRSEEDTRKLLQVVGAREEDKPLLKFWMTGLSVQYRTHILASSAKR